METDVTIPLVSIIIPAYNVESYIEETILSVKNQTLSNWELIVVDDGSTDNTYSVICKAVDSIRQNVTILQQENRGLSAARNAGMEKASGMYIYFLDSDDRLTKNALSVLYTLAKQYELDAVFFLPQLSLMICRLRVVKKRLKNVLLNMSDIVIVG